MRHGYVQFVHLCTPQWRVLAKLSLLADQTLTEQAALLKVLVYMLCCISKRKYIKNVINFKVGVGGGLGLFFSSLCSSKY